ncbi:MAG TPA: hypothetical protein VGV89_02535 [Thermoplasmata archaeon]|nr:hypothetical protein [Thermoplasmata archaeon]
MSPKRGRKAREPRGAQKWILSEVRALPPGGSLSTAELSKRITKSSKRDFHKNSVYNALRLLVRKGFLDMQRKGRQKLYQIAGAARAAPAKVARAAVGRPARRAAAPTAEMPAMPHKLALGEILVLNVGEGEVLIATNLHGRLVIERQSLAV